MPALLILTLGPVQNFIAAAKRCRDLWFGSWLLSELSKAGAAVIARDCGLDALIFPAPHAPSDLEPASEMSVANKLVALIPMGTSPQDAVDRVKNAIRQRLIHLRDEALAGKPDFDRDLTNRQLDDFIDIQWVSVPVSPTHPYATARTRAEELLTVAKNTRLWQQPAWPTGARPKSSIDGLREAVTPEPTAGNHSKRGMLGLDDREHLCGVGLIKRNGKRRIPSEATGDNHRFFSTPHLAALSVLARFTKLPQKAKHEAQTAWQRYLDCLNRHRADMDESVHPKWRSALLGGHDGQLLFASRIAERFDHLDLPEPELALKKEAALTEARPLLSKLLQALGVGEPLPYIAILLADGDRMGDAIKDLQTPEEHRKLSQCLDTFARSARDTVEESYGGQLIYAGGDDVLAFVPLHRALACARHLADDFARALVAYGTESSRPTLSVGISITHFMDPMNHALDAARRAEKLAKRERNSLAIILDKRSGPPVELTGTWASNIDHTLAALIDLHRRDAIPDKFIQDLIDLAALRQPADPKHTESLTRIADLEFQRILDRKRAGRGAKPISDDDREHLRADAPFLPQHLLIAKMLADATALASPPEDRP